MNLKTVALPCFHFLHPHRAFLKPPLVLAINLAWQVQWGRHSKHFQPLCLEKIYGGSSASHSPRSSSTPWKTPAVLNLHTFSVTDANILRQSNVHHPAAVRRPVAALLRVCYPALILGHLGWRRHTIQSHSKPWELKTLLLLFICILLKTKRKCTSLLRCCQK